MISISSGPTEIVIFNPEFVVLALIAANLGSSLSQS